MKNQIDAKKRRNSSLKKHSSESPHNNYYEKKIVRYKTILIGDSSVGKTSILQRFIHNRFKFEFNCTIGVDYWVKSLQLDNDVSIELQIWDTCGQERFKTVTRQYYRDTNGCILVFDLTKRESFRNIEVWIEDIKNFGNQEMTILIVGNKSDLIEMREVKKEEIDEFVHKYNYNYLEVSALSDENIKLCFESIGRSMANNSEKALNASGRKKHKVDDGNLRLGKNVELVNNNIKPATNTQCC